MAVGPGSVLHLHFSDITNPKEKFGILLTVDPVRFFLINSRLSAFTEQSPEHRRSQLEIDVASHEFLEHDSWVDCTGVVRRQAEWAASGKARHQETSMPGGSDLGRAVPENHRSRRGLTLAKRLGQRADPCGASSVGESEYTARPALTILLESPAYSHRRARLLDGHGERSAVTIGTRRSPR